jgi:hypothetical protein
MGKSIHGVVRTSLLACLLAPTLGCDSSGVGTTYPVAGALTVNGQPVTTPTVTVLFKPDAAKGNTTSFEPVGTVDESGQYTVKTNGRDGAPPGWYKVAVTAFSGRPEHAKTTHDRRPTVKSLLPERYGSVASSKLALEVVENPAPKAYDLKLTNP